MHILCNLLCYLGKYYFTLYAVNYHCHYLEHEDCISNQICHFNFAFVYEENTLILMNSVPWSLCDWNTCWFKLRISCSLCQFVHINSCDFTENNSIMCLFLWPNVLNILSFIIMWHFLDSCQIHCVKIPKKQKQIKPINAYLSIQKSFTIQVSSIRKKTLLILFCSVLH